MLNVKYNFNLFLNVFLFFQILFLLCLIEYSVNNIMLLQDNILYSLYHSQSLRNNIKILPSLGPPLDKS